MSTKKTSRPATPTKAATDPGAESGGLSFDSERPAAYVTETTAGDDPDSHTAHLFRESAKPASVVIEASALMPGIECPFTRGCAEKGGKVRIHSDVISTVVNDLGKKVPLRQQQLRCNRCNVIASGTKVITGGHASGQRLFNRVTGKSE